MPPPQSGQTLTGLLEISDPVPIEMKVGEVALLHKWLLHSSEIHHTATPRRLYATPMHAPCLNADTSCLFSWGKARSPLPIVGPGRPIDNRRFSLSIVHPVSGVWYLYPHSALCDRLLTNQPRQSHVHRLVNADRTLGLPENSINKSITSK